MSSALNRRNWFFEKSCETEFQTVRIGFVSVKEFVRNNATAKMFAVEQVGLKWLEGVFGGFSVAERGGEATRAGVLNWLGYLTRSPCKSAPHTKNTSDPSSFVVASQLLLLPGFRPVFVIVSAVGRLDVGQQR